jgi:hypothetical protein
MRIFVDGILGSHVMAEISESQNKKSIDVRFGYQ